MNGTDTAPLNMESSGSYNSVNSVPDETRRGPLEQAFRRRTVRDVLALVDDLDAKADFAPLERAYVVYSVLKTRQYADEGARWANLGAIIFFIGIICAALRRRDAVIAGLTIRPPDDMHISTHGESHGVRTPPPRPTVHRTK